MVLPKISAGFLVIACERTQGGLHTKNYGATTRVELNNNNNRDLIGLKDVPLGHTDYFHRPDHPELPEIWPISGCGTIYAWPVNPHHLAADGNQVVRVTMEKGVAWDIDYVALALWGNKSDESRFPAWTRDWAKEIIIGIVVTVIGGLCLLLFG